MRLSVLQKYILRQCYFEQKKLNRDKLTAFYNNQTAYVATAVVKKVKPKREDQVNIITKSIERLIERGLLVGYGIRTTDKWFIREIKLTRVGLKVARGLLGSQQKLKI
ncbi:MAG: hypothetical protein WC480_02800 [Patescibacteria group bacterium]